MKIGIDDCDAAVEEALEALEREMNVRADYVALSAPLWDPLDPPTAADLEALGRWLAE